MITIYAVLMTILALMASIRGVFLDIENERLWVEKHEANK